MTSTSSALMCAFSICVHQKNDHVGFRKPLVRLQRLYVARHAAQALARVQMNARILFPQSSGYAYRIISAFTCASIWSARNCCTSDTYARFRVL